MSTTHGDKKPTGRPSEYRPEYCELIIELMAKGYSFEVCASRIGVSKNTLYQWVKEFPAFQDAKAVAFEKSRDFWETVAIENVVNTSTIEYDEQGNRKSTTKSLNSAAWIFNMKNRFGWRDRIETSTADALEDVEELHTGMTKAQALELLNAKKGEK